MKKYLLIILILLILVGGGIFLFTKCNFRTKEPTTTTPPATETDYRSAFVKANTDFVCAIEKDQELLKDETKMKEILNAAYKKYDMPVTDNQLMIEILKLYENDADVTQEIRDNVKNCPA